MKNLSTKNVSEAFLVNLMKGTHAISSRISKVDLFRKLFEIILKETRTQKGVIILGKNGQLWIESQATMKENGQMNFKLYSDSQFPKIDPSMVPVSVIDHVNRTQQHVVLNTVQKNKQYMVDPYVHISKPRSIFCTLIKNSEKELRVIYLESKQTSDAFSPEMITTLLLLCEQFVISFENIRRYTHLEHRVAKQTHELNIAKRKNRIEKKAKTHFLANMSHEFHTPLNAIVGFSQLLQAKGKKLELPEEFQHYLLNIQKSGVNLSELINNILDFSKVDSSTIGQNKEKINLRLLIQGVFHLNKELANRKNIKFTYEFGNQLPTVIISDRTALNRVLMGLVKNALKSTPNGKSVSLKATFNNDHFCVAVKDERIDIPIQKQEHVFDTPTQIKEEYSWDNNRSEFSLAVIKKIVKKLKGEISCINIKNQGSCFTVKIPFNNVLSDEKHGVRVEPGLFASENKVLAVDNVRSNQEMFQALFQELGVEIQIATNEAIGFDKTIEIKPDLIILNIHMPGMDKNALKFMQQIRNKPETENIPIIALSVDRLHYQQIFWGKTNFLEYLPFPFKFDEMIQILKKHLRPHSDVRNKMEKGPVVTKFPKNQAFYKYPVKPPFPENLRREFLKDLSEMSNIPIYKGGSLRTSIQKMIKSCEKYDSEFLFLLYELESCIFIGDEDKFNVLISEALSSLS